MKSFTLAGETGTCAATETIDGGWLSAIAEHIARDTETHSYMVASVYTTKCQVLISELFLLR